VIAVAIIGREREQSILRNCLLSDKSEFIAVYGRRRVGKTFLINEFFDNRMLFYSTGVLNGNREMQLQAWNDDMNRVGGTDLAHAENWFDAFRNLNLLIEKQSNKQPSIEKKVIFLDEIPWMATLHSDFLPALDFFWNRRASSRKDILLIICGSAASWITEKIINNKGGLHNRLTRSIFIEPFSLNECEQYYKSQNIPMTRHQMAEAYMIFGGIPYYLSLMQPQYSLYQNIDEIYFSQNSELKNEFDNLYRSLFKNTEHYINIIETLAKKGIGLTRSEISTGAGITDGGTLTKILRDLAVSGFIREYKSYGQKKKDSLFQLVDFFSLFDIRFREKRSDYSNDYWLRFSSTSTYSAWAGYSFEKLCLLHLPQIRAKLGISGVLTSTFSWRGKAENSGAQIDLIIDRNDNVINLCEIKFSSATYKMDKKDYDSIINKRSVFSHSTRTNKAIQTTMITTYGLARNNYSAEITSEITLNDLFYSI